MWPSLPKSNLSNSGTRAQGLQALACPSPSLKWGGAVMTLSSSEYKKSRLQQHFKVHKVFAELMSVQKFFWCSPLGLGRFFGSQGDPLFEFNPWALSC